MTNPSCDPRIPVPGDRATSIVPIVEGEGRLLVRLQAGDDEALRQILDRLGPFVMGVARRVSGSGAVAEEVLQDVITSLWRHPDRFDPARGSLRAFLGVQAHRRAVDAVRKESRLHAREELASGLVWLEGGKGGCVPEHAIDDSDVTDAVRRAIDRLPDEQRRAVELAFWDGRTHREVAAILGIPEGTAKSRLRLAQRKLAEWLAPVTAGSR